jgi:serine/threonine protein kinase
MPATILFLSANPSNTSPLEVDEEYRAVEVEMRLARLREAFDLRPVLAARIDDVRRKLAEHGPTVVHFGGHGARGSGAGRGALAPPGAGTSDVGRGEILLRGDDGRAAPVPVDALAELFRLEGKEVRCVVLNACHTLPQAEAIAAHVSCAIGTTRVIEDAAAIAFAKGFYGKLCGGGSVQEAFEAGRNSVALARAGDPGVLVLRCRDGVRPGEVRLAKAPLEVEPRYEDAESRALAMELEAARARRRALHDAGASTEAPDREILALRRRLREGGRLRPGDALENDRYLLIEHVGRGGFASVWAALDRERGERVAIKVLHPDQAREPSRRERFFRGARVMADLKHEAVVRVLNPHGEDGGYLYFVMELVSGGDLHRAVVEGRLPKESVVPLILRVGEALAEAHARGIVHRDVKPANILLDAEGAPRLTDFDLAAARDTTGGTGTGAMGTFLFAAPEQMKNAAEADARADVYGLGMTAIFCLHGGELPESILREPALLLDTLPCKNTVRGVLARAIRWDREARFADSRELSEALKRACEVGEYAVAPGTLLAGRYRIDRLLRLEGFGALFLATEQRTGAAVAVKIHDALSEASPSKPALTPGQKNVVRQRFRREVEAMKRIHSRHVPRVLEVAEDDEHGLVVCLEPIEGESLIDRLKREGPLPLETIHPIFERVWIGLDDIHKVGVVHRDIKPSNLFLESGPDGATRVKILDFGLCKLATDPLSLTEIGQSLGTFSFMPPEMIGKAKTVDHRADIYACGTAIFQALSGELPYCARNILEMVDLKVKTEARRLGEVMGERVGTDLEAFLVRALARDRSQRFQTAEDALVAWRRLTLPVAPPAASGA